MTQQLRVLAALSLWWCPGHSTHVTRWACHTDARNLTPKELETALLGLSSLQLSPGRHKPQVERDPAWKRKLGWRAIQEATEACLCPWCSQRWGPPYKYIDVHSHSHSHEMHLKRKENVSETSIISPRTPLSSENNHSRSWAGSMRP